MSQTSTRITSVPDRARAALDSLFANVAIQDYLVMAFHTLMWCRVMLAPDGPDAELARRFATALLTVTVSSVLLVRGEILKPGPFRALVYRVGVFSPMVISYFELRFLLPALRPELVDLQLMRLDELLWGVTPAVWFATWNTRAVVEWFSFFYYGYFALMSLFLILPLFLDQGDRLVQLTAGAAMVCALGHIGYTLVPGAGPYATLTFAEPIDGGFWWHQVLQTVESAGAHLDIFPSLHTAYPVYFVLHAYGFRRTMPYRVTWHLIAFFAANMVVATMFLRWHWFVDVVAGLCLAATARAFAVWVGRRSRERAADGVDRQPVWEPLFSWQRP